MLGSWSSNSAGPSHCRVGLEGLSDFMGITDVRLNHLMMSPTSTVEPSTLEYALFLCRGRSVASLNDPHAFPWSITILDQAGTVIDFERMKELTL